MRRLRRLRLNEAYQMCRQTRREVVKQGARTKQDRVQCRVASFGNWGVKMSGEKFRLNFQCPVQSLSSPESLPLLISSSSSSSLT